MRKTFNVVVNKKMQQFVRFIQLVVIWAPVIVVVIVDGDSQNTARRVESSAGRAFSSPCGNGAAVAKRVGECMSPLTDLIEGKFDRYPTTDEDHLANCNRFNSSEKCLRQLSKDCIKLGLHRSLIGTFSSSIVRFRRQECKNVDLRSRFVGPVKCYKDIDEQTIKLYKNVTGYAQAIRDLNISPEDKLIKVCCLLNELDKQLEDNFNKACQSQTKFIMSLIGSVTDDARTAVCLRPKCTNALSTVGGSKYKPPQRFIEPIMEILLQMTTE